MSDGVALSLTRPATPPQQPQPSEETLRVAKEFESVFIAEMMAPMFEGLDTDGLGGGGAGEAMFRPMLIEQYANALSKSGGVGLADSIVRELMRIQSRQTPDTSGGADGADR